MCIDCPESKVRPTDTKQPYVIRLFQLALIGCLLIAGAGGIRADLINPISNLNLPGPAGKNETLTKAGQCFQKGQYEQCFLLLNEAVEKQPDLPAARLLLAQLFLSTNQLRPGRASLEQAAAEHPDLPDIYLTFGRLHLAEGSFTDAQLHYQKALSLAAHERWKKDQKQGFLRLSHAGLASVAEARKDWQLARTHFVAWLELEPNNGRTRQRLGRALFFLDRPEESLKELRRAVQDDPQLDPAAVSLAHLYSQKGDLKKAEEWMQTAVRSDSKHLKTRVAYAVWLLERGRADEAHEHAKAASQLDPKAKALQHLNGLIARHRKDFALAEQLFETLYQELPGDFASSNQLALILSANESEAKRRRGLQLAEVNARQYPNSTEALSTLGWTYYLHGRWDEAERCLRAAVQGGTASSDTAYYLARVLAGQGRTAEAKKLLEPALATPGAFANRHEAQEWLTQLTKPGK